MFFSEQKSEIGTVSVATTEFKGHDVDFWAKTLSDRIVSVGEECHHVIAQQAVAFKDAVLKLIAYYMREAIKSDRTTLINELNRQGHEDVAEIIRRL